MSRSAAPAPFVAPPAPESSVPAAVGPVGPVVVGSGWVFIPVSRHAVVPRGFLGGEVARAASVTLARAIVGCRVQAWSGRGPSGGWGVFVAR